MEASKVDRMLTGRPSSSPAERGSDPARSELLSISEGRGSGRMGGESGERQIKGTKRVSWTFARSTSRCPWAAASAHLFQVAASRSACGQRAPRRSTTSSIQAASPAGQMTCNASSSSCQAGKGGRRACKKTRFAWRFFSKVASVPIQ